MQNKLSQTTWDYIGLYLMKVLSLILTYDFNNTASYVIVLCLFYKIVVSCITKCVTETLMKIMMTRRFKEVDQIYSCIRSQLEKEMATHSSILAWRTPRTEEPSGLQYMGSEMGCSVLEEGGCCGEMGTRRTGLQTDIFRSWFYEPNSCISSHLEKHLSPS